ncbi:mariner Mos1 transposase [Trichonephila clavipes]|nr:mariner Mos1 transposase [Trichonephila clavipes]
MSNADIQRQITEVYGTEAMNGSKVRKLVRKFKDGRTNIRDEERSGQTSVIIDVLIQAAETKNSFTSSLDLLIRCDEEGDDILSRIVTGDKTWVSHINPESKQQSMEWRLTSSPIKVKAKQTLSKRKIMPTVFWDRRGVLLVDFMPQGIKINSDAYCATQQKLRRALQNKRRGMLSNGVLFLHDNTRNHSSRTTRDLIGSFGWEVLDHAPYSHDLAPSDFHLFRYLKHSLGGKRFSDNKK